MKITFLFTTLSVGLILSGCGGGGSSESSNSTSSTIASSIAVISSSHSSSNSVSSSVSSSESTSSTVNSISSSDSSSSVVSAVSSSESSSVNSSAESSSSELSSSSESNSSSESSSESSSLQSSSQASSASTQIFHETFTVDKATLFSASYKSITGLDPAVAFFYITGNSSTITQADGQLTIAGSRLSIGNRTPAVATTSTGVVSGEFDLSRAYVIKLKISASSGAGGFQVFVDNNTTSASNSPLGNASRVLSQAANTLVANEWIEIKPTVGTQNSFISLRTESTASVTIDEMIVEYLSGDAVSSTSSSSQSSSRSSLSSSSSSLSSSSSRSSSSISFSSSSLSSFSESSASSSSVSNTTACQQLINDSSVNWRESSLQTDQEIVACLYNSLGKAVGFGEKATGGYNPAGGSNLIVIKKNTGVSLEQQILDAISTTAYNWIVFDKDDFASESDIAMYRLNCSDAAVLSALDGATQAQCLNHTTWCAAKGVSSASCAATFFNSKLNNSALAIRNKMIMSNTTIDGRGSKAYFFFSGLKIGADDSGASTHVSQNVIITNMEFRGAGHVEDHGLDPDMIRSTGASRDIWIHQNTFDTAGDSAFDVKVGAYDITVSFNLVKNVKRAALHGSSDSHTIDTQIKTTIHNNAFVTTDADYSALGNTMRRVPLLRHGQSHMFNNVFYGYRKDLMSIRVGGRLLFENNMIVNNISNSEGDDISYWAGNLVDSAYENGGLRITGSYVWAGDGNCQLQGTGSDLSASYGSTPDMNALYSSTSQATISANRFTAGKDLADYVFATAGKGGKVPYNSPYTAGRAATIAARPVSCQ
jgi:pectate lyase